MILAVLKTTYKKGKPKEIVYRSFKNYDKNVVSIKLSDKLIDCHNYNEFKDGCLQILNTHAPLKKRLVRANEVPYMTKTLRKAIANRSRLENQYYKNKSGESLRAYKKQKNFCSRLYKKERKRYYTNLSSCVRVHVCTRLRVYAFTCIRVYVCTCVRVYVCTCLRVYVGTWVRV